MVAGSTVCECPECGVVCEGRFAGCTRVWASGPKLVNARRDQVANNSSKSRDPVSAGGGSVSTIGSGPRSALPVVAGGHVDSDENLTRGVRARLEDMGWAVGELELSTVHQGVGSRRSSELGSNGTKRNDNLGAHLSENGGALLALRTDIAALAATMAETTEVARSLTGDRSYEANAAVFEQLEDLRLLNKDIVVRLERMEDKITSLEPVPPLQQAGKGQDFQPAMPYRGPRTGIHVSTGRVRRSNSPGSRDPG